MLQMLRFLTDMMSKLAPALNKLQGYLNNIGDLNLVANQEFHSVSCHKENVYLFKVKPIEQRYLNIWLDSFSFSW